MLFYPIHEIKAKFNILEFFKKDGHVMQRRGANYFCLCPFHEEKTPSCSVSEEKQIFHCFGCEIGGDLIKYWERSRGVHFKEALKDLAEMAGVAPESGLRKPSIIKPRSSFKPPEPTTIPLDKKKLLLWAKSCERLKDSPDEIERIAHWRGYSQELVHWAAEEQWIGIMDYMDEMREAFLVKSPTPRQDHLTSVSFHIRLAPQTTGNLQDKASWRFWPTGQRSWPFVIGSPHRASTIYLTEGQWDALALCELMQWHRHGGIFQDICVIGLRGAASGKLLSAYTINPDATLIAFADSDNAGKTWLAPGGLLDQLQPRVNAVYGFLPTQKNSDLNDRLKQGMTREELLASVPDYPSIKTLGALMADG
jgi:hypothetical protein